MSEGNGTKAKASEPNSKFEEKLKEIIDKTIGYGKLMIIATNRHGKTNAAMHVIRKLREIEDHKRNAIKLTIFDTVLEWRHRFDSIPYVDMDKVRFLPLVQDLLVDVPYTDSLVRRNAIGEVILNDFIHKRNLKEKHKGEIPYIDIYVVEEIQNCLGSYSLNGNLGRFWLTMVSECGNYGQVLIGLGQRFADISTKVVDRTRYYLIGATSGDRDKAKIRGIGGQKLADKISTLKKGEFVFFDKEKKETLTLIYFPKFKQKDKPYPHESNNGDSGYVKEIYLS